MSRRRFIVRRLAQAVPTVLGVTLLVFLLLHLVPGDPARALLGPRATPEMITRLHREWGLDQPLYVQFQVFLSRLARGDLGDSIFLDASVRSLIAQRIPVTGLVILLGVTMTILLTVPLAALAASRRDSAVDYVVRAVPIVGLGMPSFWIGIMLVLAFSLGLGIFPVGDLGEGWSDYLRSLVLPALTIAIGITPITIRSLRASMIEVLGADYVSTARVKGVSGPRLILRHVLPNAAIPTITVLAVNVGFLIGGIVVIEQVFALPGLGQLLYLGISNRDFAVVQGVTLVFAAAVVLTNLLTDVTYSLIDPRVTLR